MNLFLHCLHFSHLQSTLHLMRCIYWNVFFHCSKQFLNSSVFMSFSASAVFCFTSFMWAKRFPLRTFFFNLEKQKPAALGEIRWVGRVGHRGHGIFWSKTAEHSAPCGQVRSINHPSWNGQMLWKSLQKTFTEAERSLSQQFQLVHWHRWVPRTLT